MRNIIATVFSVLFASAVYAGPACCGVGAKASKSSDNDSARLNQAPAEIVKCNLNDLSNYIKTGKELSTTEMQHLLAAKLDVVLIDARTPMWDDGKRIASAINLTPESSDTEIEAALGSKDSFVVTYCGSIQCSLSHKMADRIKELGYNNTLVYSEGMAGWTNAGNPVN